MFLARASERIGSVPIRGTNDLSPEKPGKVAGYGLLIRSSRRDGSGSPDVPPESVDGKPLANRGPAVAGGRRAGFAGPGTIHRVKVDRPGL